MNVGDTVTFWLADETFDKFKGVVENVPVKRLPKPEIIYEDNQIIIMNKAPGGAVPESGTGGCVHQ